MAASLLALLKAIPPLWKMFQEAADLYYAEMTRRDENKSAERLRQMDSLLAALKQPGLKNEDAGNIRRLLYDITRRVL